MTSSEPTFVVGIDLGGTKMLAAVVDSHGQISGRSKRKSLPKSDRQAAPDIVAERMARTVRDAVDKAGLTMADIAGIGASAPGPVNVDMGRVYRVVNLPKWDTYFDLGPVLSEYLGVPVYVDNDVTLGTLGEATYGAAKGLDDVIGIFVGTGIGAGIILDGKLRHGFRWGAGEIGHMLNYHGTIKDIEHFASRGAISRKMREAVAKGKSSIVADILTTRGDDRITSGVIRDALAAGDTVTQSIVADAQQGLGLLIASVVNLLDPQCIVMGGGLVESLGDRFLEPVRDIAFEHFFLKDDADKIMIVPAALGDDAVALGGAVLARQRGGG